MTPTPEALAQARKAVKTCLELSNTDCHMFEDWTPEDGMACSKCIARALAEQDKLYQEVCRNLHDTLSGIATALALPPYLRAGEAEAPGYPHILAKIAFLAEQARAVERLRIVRDLAIKYRDAEKYLEGTGRADACRALDKALVDDFATRAAAQGGTP